MAVVTKLFKDSDAFDQAMENLKAKSYEAKVVEPGTDVKKELSDSGLSQEALDYYELGLSLGGKVVKVTADDKKAGEVQYILREAGAKEGVEQMDMWSTSPGFVGESRMSATNPIDETMTGDFRKY